MSRNFHAVLAAATVCVALAGCRHMRTAAPEGRAGFRFVDPAPPPGLKGETSAPARLQDEQYVPAKPIGALVAPVYPRAVLEAKPEFATVGVRITVGIDGRVSDTTPSLVAFSTPSRYAAEFRAAVDAAIAQWRFRPAELVQLETVRHPDGDFRRVKTREAVEAAAEVIFTFTATGEVLNGALGK